MLCIHAVRPRHLGVPALAAAAGLLALAGPALAGPAAVPGAPRSVTATAGNAAITVAWQPPTSTGGSAITGYTAACKAGSSTPKTTTVAGSLRKAVVKGLTNGQAYTCTVTAKNASGTGPASAATKAVTPVGPPSAPRTVYASTAGAVLTVSWKAPASTGGSALTGYAVSCTSNDGGTTLTGSAAGTAKNVKISGLPANHTYACSVTASNAKGSSAAAASADLVMHAIVTTSAPTATLHLPVKAGQRATLRGSGTTVNSDGCQDLSISTAGGAQVADGCLYKNESLYVETSATFSADGTATGTITPPAGASGAVELAAWAYTDLSATLVVGAPATTFTITAPGQFATYSFAGTAGEKVGITTSASTDTGTTSLQDPSDQELLFGRWYVNYTYTNGPVTLPSAATYHVLAVPDSYATGTTTLRLVKG